MQELWWALAEARAVHGSSEDAREGSNGPLRVTLEPPALQPTVSNSPDHGGC